MPNVTFAVPEQIYQKMKAHSEVKWSEVARRAIIKYLRKYDDDKDWRDYSKKLALNNWDEAGDLFEF